MSSIKTDDKASDIPEHLIDSKKGVTYRRLRFFGKVIIGIFLNHIFDKSASMNSDEVCLTIDAGFSISILKLSTKGFTCQKTLIFDFYIGRMSSIFKILLFYQTFVEFVKEIHCPKYRKPIDLCHSGFIDDSYAENALFRSWKNFNGQFENCLTCCVCCLSLYILSPNSWIGGDSRNCNFIYEPRNTNSYQ